jgi:DNA polymerase I-like protein with 3'-5' exonuclease and polymerase domains
MLPFYLNPPDPSHFESEPYVVLDFETTNINNGDSRTPENRIIPKRCLLVAHNAKFELGWLIRHGHDLSDVLVWDTMIAEYVLRGNVKAPLDLDYVAKSRGLGAKERIIDILMKGGVCPSDMPEHLLRRRVVQDVETTEALFLQQRAELKERGLLPVMLTRCATTVPLAYIEREGMTLDPDRVQAAHKIVSKDLAEAEQRLATITGGINTRSGDQVATYLYDTLGFEEVKDRRGNPVRTGAGKRKTDKETLAALKATTDEQKEFLELRKRHAKAADTLSKSLTFFKGVCDKYGGRFMANFHQTRTKTHRLSSSGRKLLFRVLNARGKEVDKYMAVQFQNMERAYKSLFKPRDADSVMIEVDGAGLEFRIAADLARDEQARADILDPDHDVHTFTASVIGNCDTGSVSKAQRTAAKRHTFKPLFSTGTGGTKSEVRYYQEFKKRYAAITEMQERWITDVMRTGQLRIPSGLICYWKLKMAASGFIEGSNEVRNLPIQSFATADIIHEL